MIYGTFYELVGRVGWVCGCVLLGLGTVGGCCDVCRYSHPMLMLKQVISAQLLSVNVVVVTCCNHSSRYPASGCL